MVRQSHPLRQKESFSIHGGGILTAAVWHQVKPKSMPAAIEVMPPPPFDLEASRESNPTRYWSRSRPWL
jgi:hypothetical protein